MFIITHGLYFHHNFFLSCIISAPQCTLDISNSRHTSIDATLDTQKLFKVTLDFPSDEWRSEDITINYGHSIRYIYVCISWKRGLAFSDPRLAVIQVDACVPFAYCKSSCDIFVIYIYITARHFRWPCAIYADTGVFKIRITILKSMRFVAFLWDFSQITSNHQSNTKNNI